MFGKLLVSEESGRSHIRELMSHAAHWSVVQYGVGYTLTLSKTHGTDSEKLVALMEKHVPDAAVFSDAGGIYGGLCG